jgi:hypothetical protein
MSQFYRLHNRWTSRGGICEISEGVDRQVRSPNFERHTIKVVESDDHEEDYGVDRG